MKPPGFLVENRCGEEEGTGPMNQEPQRVAREGAVRDGLAAVAIVLLTAVLVALVISNLI